MPKHQSSTPRPQAKISNHLIPKPKSKTRNIVDPSQALDLLTNLSPHTKIELEKLPTGELMVRMNGIIDSIAKTKEQIIQKNYAPLIGQPITASEAAEKYRVHRNNIFRWVDKSYISVIASEPVMQVDEAEVKYCVDTFKKKKESGLGYRGPLFDEDGLPYELKHPTLSEYRRRKNKER